MKEGRMGPRGEISGFKRVESESLIHRFVFDIIIIEENIYTFLILLVMEGLSLFVVSSNAIVVFVFARLAPFSELPP